MRIKDIGNINARVLREETPRDYTFQYIDIGGVSNDGQITLSEPMRYDESPSRARRIVKQNDVIVSTVRTYLRAIAGIDWDAKDTIASTGFAVISPDKKYNPTYVKYLMTSDAIVNEICKGSTGVSYPAINTSRLSAIHIPDISLNGQTAIAAYLDKQLSSINNRICLRERELQTLIKLKQSEINSVITRGLDATVSMKDSGISWIGQIPAHWEVRRFKEIFKSYTTGITPESKNPNNFETEGGYPWITIADIGDKKYVKSGSLNLSERVIRNYAPPITRKGSLLFSFKLSIGKVAFAEEDLYTNEAIVSIPPSKKLCFDFFYYLLPSVLLNNATENIYGAKMLNQKIIANMCFPLPPKEEQERIADYLNTKFKSIDDMINNINAQVEKLKLLKRSLINEVISGERHIEL